MLSNSINNFALVALLTSCAAPPPKADAVPAPVQPPDFCATPKPPNTLRVMTFNIHAGRTAPIADVAKFIATFDADLVFVQEVDIGVRRTDRVDQVDVLTRHTSLSAQFFKTIDYQGGDYGIAILYRGRLQNVDFVALPSDDESRYALSATLELFDREIPFAAAHLGGSEETKQEQIHQLFEIGRNANFILGDFNLQPHEIPPELTAQEWVPAIENPKTITADIRGEKMQIDYIFNREKPACSKVYPTTLSDHHPVVATFTLD